ncbi:MAG: hypothetical protein C0616_08900 [Desulfuromonas sp.]|nr:MAG: hypothetical protein C0616_08900 [Desulfuromonas sp.]
MKIEILGDGCRRCAQMKERVCQALDELEMEAEVVSVVDPEVLASYHAISLPGLVVNGRPSAGPGHLSVEAIKQILQQGDTG